MNQDNVQFPILSYATFDSKPLADNPFANPRSLILMLINMSMSVFGTLALLRPSFISCGPSACISLCQSAIDRRGPIATPLEMYKLNTGRYPAALLSLCQRSPGGTQWQGPYIEDPTKLIDPWGSQYQYRCPGKNGRAYDLWSMGPDKISNTQDDITNCPKQ